MKFSIITPVFNSFHLMKSYFFNLENQIFKDFEVIIIDDSSTDKSYENIIKYKESSNLNIKVLRSRNNMGPGIARNIGLSEAVGQYIIFLDSDDYIDLNCLFDINLIIEKNKCDCVIFDYYHQKGSNKKYGVSIPKQPEGFVDIKTAIANSTGSVCCKVYKRENIEQNGIRFPQLQRFEDMVFNKLALSSSKEIFYLKKPLYYYVKHEESIVHNINYQNTIYAVSAFNIVEEKLKFQYPNEVEAIFIKEVLYSTIMLLISLEKKRHDILYQINKYNGKYPNWSKNNYIKYFAFHQKVVLFMIKHKFFIGLKFMSYLKSKLK
ncbi:glycosyltransferase involved in cell wall biosynthesis [Herbinix hemicellulosilytica]|uniref:Glycosyltransferase 2-like domain-containing protein n=1 Tax=Herbinix hemicellulosilytica TaxID=1564487 RepID=A0A0H5SG77_HERHM|nr:glycosyltransferase family 2 protein [Herbinix hemicellulosilytica]RBP60805.1 glycosyltransferase involved in cell wall biosynthesis [Herbinix hemicellulosilytica]CRZ34497.1 hypothetical protein HHT355_1295 [Herbinix hemicellulosilytica]